MHKISILGVVTCAAIVGGLLVACGDDGGSKFGDGTDSGNPDPTLFEGGFGVGPEGGSAVDGGDPYKNDPPPMYCLLDAGGPTPAPVTGTADCPSDKNKPGCACDTQGMMAPCWTGLRKNRHLGVCKDGVTTCEKHGELGLTWGDCTGEVLPTPGATKGKPACQCFSAGQWKLTNTSPCFETFNGAPDQWAVSTVDDGSGAKCPPVGMSAPPPAPAQDWSKDTVTVDCEGHFKLCYEIKAGDYDHPAATDCSVVKVCVEGDYPKAGVETPFPNLPGWASKDSTCGTKFVASGGYGEMTVVGEDILCDKIDDGSGKPYVFNRVKYCPLSCNMNPSDPACMNCQQGGSGMF